VVVIRLAQLPVAYIDIRFFSHATEDENKVTEAVKKILPSEHVDEIVFEKHTLRGHHGNPITFFETRTKNKEALKAIVKNLASHLGTLDKENLRQNISTYTEKGSLYLRLDKQAAFQGAFKLSQIDPIHFHLRFKKQNIAEICRELGIIS
jgi:RNA binding exosome subunit